MRGKQDPVHKADDEARAIAKGLLLSARTAALAVIEPGTGRPFVSRIALGISSGGAPMTLVSDLAVHARAMRADPHVSLLVGETGAKGDPMSHPRLTIRARAEFIKRGTALHDAARKAWLETNPKSKLYVDFADFNFVIFETLDGHLNAGFGKAYALGKIDLRLTG
ncbi:MAG: pyridoxamine 5'-phosphate oxidase family protein [Rhodobacteraceae bacterium]|nr:pyridoxamine 5'-phosphate oxidase family protein [Paracoccaceae bacterium]